MSCKQCGSVNLQKRGIVRRKNGVTYQRLQCSTCGTWDKYELRSDVHHVVGAYPTSVNDVIEDSSVAPEVVVESDHRVEGEGFIITSFTRGSDYNKDFFAALQKYAHYMNVDILIIPTHTVGTKSIPVPAELQPYVIEKNYHLDKYRIFGGCAINPTAASPLSGMDPLSKGTTSVFGHPQLQMKTLPVTRGKDAVILTTTGSISEKNYLHNKAGVRGDFNHQMSAVIVHNDPQIEGFHLRHLIWSDGCFHDLNTRVTPDDVYHHGHTKALVLGDEHVMFVSPSVVNNTFGPGGMVETLNPDILVRHDILDAYTISHHHENNYLLKFKKYVNNENSIANELKETCQYLCDTSDRTSIVVDSNHNNHLTKWLNGTPNRDDINNAEMFHYLTWLCLREIREGNEDPNPLELFLKNYYSEHPNSQNIRFLGVGEAFYVGDINISMHGDRGPGGARGSRQSLSKIGEKSIISHSHSPGIEKCCYQAGTSSVLDLEYAVGAPSSWLNTHCVIHDNGSRQLINIIGGKWKT